MDPRSKIPDGTRVEMSGKELVFGESIFQLEEATDIQDDTEALRERMGEEGYLLIRGFFDRESILKARKQILEHMLEKGVLDPDSPVEEGVIGPGNKGVSGTGFPNEVIQRMPAFLDIVNSDRAFSFFDRFLSGEAMSLDHKWLRAIGHGRNSSCHCDIVYMGAGTDRLYTMWTALGDIPLEMGPISVCLGSHKLEKLKATYGAADAHNDLVRGDFSRDPLEMIDKFGIRWASALFQAGDVLIFGMYFMHASLQNQTQRFRISCDTRYQLASEPVDTRHMGETPDQIPKAKMEDRVPTEEARAKWGV